MKIKSFKIERFKSIMDMEIMLDSELSILTGVNNCGKTTVLEAIAFWADCFQKLIHRAERGHKGRYNKGDFIFKADSQSYFDFSSFPCIHCANVVDVFPERDPSGAIVLTANLADDFGLELSIPIVISIAKPARFFVTVYKKASFDYKKLNAMMRALPNSIATYFATPVADILPEEFFQTEPFLKTKVEERKSIEVLRNRLFRLLSTSGFSQFCQDLSYILYGKNMSKQIFFSSPSNITTDKVVIIEYWTSTNHIRKEISMLGSGTLQTIEILLNLYHNVEDRTDLNIVLLDEPDSHIHRDVQGRLLEVLSRVTKSNQIVLTTHNESMIRSASLKNLFHIDSSVMGRVTCMYKKDLPDLHTPRFKGLYPGFETPLLQSLSGRSTGLDFINAIEADRIVFVEGEDDARVLYHLMMTNVSNQTKKVVFWVMGGVSQIISNMGAYKTVLSAIKNRISLWDKSALVFDCDCLSDKHLKGLLSAIQSTYSISVYVPPVYTMESIALSDFSILSGLLCKYFSIDPVNQGPLSSALQKETQKREPAIRARFVPMDNHSIQEYKGTYIERINKIRSDAIPRISDIDLKTDLESHYSSCPLLRLANKNDVEDIVNAALQSIGEKSIYHAENYPDLVQNADAALLFDEWKSLISFLSQ